MTELLQKKISSKEAVIGFIGLGYIGLSLLEVFGNAGFPTVGFDINQEKVAMLKREESYFNFLPLQDLFSLMCNKRFEVSDNASILEKADVIFICVPTSLDEHFSPDLTALRKAFQTAVKFLKKDRLIILQSTTYPGTTVQELLPLLEQSGLKAGKDFNLGYAPETADIGNPNYQFNAVPKVVAGISSDCLKMTELLYQLAGFHVVTSPSTQVAEAAKILQNSFRLINISFINEMKIMLDRMGIDIWEVVQAASTKPFGFMPFYPSAGAGGDCIPTDPEYLIWKARTTDGPTTMLEMAAQINRAMPHYVVEKVIEGLNREEKSVKGAKILLLGVGYKKDVNDIRESAALPILFALKQREAIVHYHDPFVHQLPPLPRFPELDLKSEAFDLQKLKDYDAVIITADHTFYDWSKITAHSRLIIDTLNATSVVEGAKHNVIKA